MSGTKILYVIENSSFGGGEKSFAELINGLGQEFDIYVACSKTEPFYGQIKQRAKVVTVDFSNRYNIFNIFALACIIKEYKIDIVHSQGSRVDFYAALASRIVRVPHISTVAMPVEGFDVCLLKKTVYSFFSRLGENMTDRLIVVSETLKKTMIEKHGIPLEKVSVIPNSVNAEIFENAKPDRNLILKHNLSGKRVIGCAARLVWQKGLEYLIEAMTILRKTDPAIFEQTICIIGGEGEREESLKTLVKKLELESKVIFTGFVNNVPAFLKTLDIFVMPSLREGQPIALLEAMAAAKPIIASAIEGITETVTDGVDALLVPPADSVSLADAFRKLLKHKNLAESISSNAKKKVSEKFSTEIFITQHIEVYKQALRT